MLHNRSANVSRYAPWLLALFLAVSGAGIGLAESPAASGDQAWPAFRGVGTSLTTAADLPLSWSDEAGIRWTAELPGYGQSSPVVWGDRVFVTTMQGDNKETPTVLCFALDSGEELWQREFVSSQPAPVSNYVSRAAPTPAVDENRLYASFESGDIFAIDHDGQDVWSRSCVRDYGPIEGIHGIGSSLAMTREGIIVLMNHGGPSYLVALDKETGETHWKTNYDQRVGWSSPIVYERDGREMILTSAAGIVEAFDAADGERLWQMDGLSGNSVPSPTTDGNVVVVGSTDKPSNLALLPPDAAADDPPRVLWRSDGPSCSFGSPLIHRGRVYFVNAAGVAYCVDLKSGSTLWAHRLADSCWASPIGAGDRIYFFAKDGTTIVARAGREWEELARNTVEVPPGGKVYGAATVEGVILLRTGNRLTCVAEGGDR